MKRLWAVVIASMLAAPALAQLPNIPPQAPNAPPPSNLPPGQQQQQAPPNNARPPAPANAGKAPGNAPVNTPVSVPTTCTTCQAGSPLATCTSAYQQAGAQMRVEADYLLWWLKPNHITTPLVLTSIDPTENLAASFSAGGLNDPNSRVIFGHGNVERGGYSGGRLTLAMDSTGDVAGGELVGLWLPRQGNNFRVSSNSNAVPTIILPYFAVDPAPNGHPLGETGGGFAGTFNGVPSPGAVNIHTANELWGAEANAVFGMVNDSDLQVGGIVGLRYLALRDELSIAAGLTGQNGQTYDSFRTLNQFYGGQVGARIGYTSGAFRAMLSSKVALGDSNQKLDIAGAARVTDASAAARGSAPQLPGGFYTASSNIGHGSNDEFSVISDTNLTLAYQLTNKFSLNLGYTFLYWNSVMRTGDQVDRRMNQNLNPNFAPFIGNTGGPPAPSRLERTTDFWAHGINAGAEVKF